MFYLFNPIFLLRHDTIVFFYSRPIYDFAQIYLCANKRLIFALLHIIDMND
jgi:hypothetical protein